MKPALFHVTASLVLLTAASNAHAQSYQFIDLGSGAAAGINNLGQVVGSSGLGATLWNGSTAVGLAGGANGGATAINNAGQVAGYISDSSGYSGAVLWSGGTLTSLPGPGRSSIAAYGINDAGQAVGSYEGYTTGALQWNNGNGPIYLNTDGQSVVAYNINSSGSAAGMSFDPASGSTRATLWSNGSATLLPGINNVNNGIGATASDINNAGVVVGSSNTGPDAPNSYAVEWHGNSTTELGTLGGSYSSANAINNRGQVVGWSDNASGAQFATIWQGNTAVNLNRFLTPAEVQAGWVLTSARDINDNGWIVGNASNTKTGANDAFLLEVSPVPEPETASMLLAGAGLLCMALRGRRQEIKYFLKQRGSTLARKVRGLSPG